MNNSDLKTLQALENKANSQGRMPSLKRVNNLLDSLNIDNTLENWSETKQTSSGGLRYSTGGGKKLYEGFRLTVPEINMKIESTDSYYSWNTWLYAQQLRDLVKSRM